MAGGPSPATARTAGVHDTDWPGTSGGVYPGRVHSGTVHLGLPTSVYIDWVRLGLDSVSASTDPF